MYFNSDLDGDERGLGVGRDTEVSGQKRCTPCARRRLGRYPDGDPAAGYGRVEDRGGEGEPAWVKSYVSRIIADANP